MTSSGNAAVFLDRDGVIFREVDYLWRIEDAQLIPGVVQALERLQGFFHLFVVTNQAGIAKGLFSLEDYQVLTSWMHTAFRRKNIRIDDVRFCPHHPEGSVVRYRLSCSCRKPNPGMILDLTKAHHIDLRRSWCIGDKTTDIAAGQRAGCRTILVRSGYGGNDNLVSAAPDHIADDLLSAAAIIEANR